jgi:hypothetical protein
MRSSPLFRGKSKHPDRRLSAKANFGALRVDVGQGHDKNPRFTVTVNLPLQ